MTVCEAMQGRWKAIWNAAAAGGGGGAGAYQPLGGCREGRVGEFLPSCTRSEISGFVAVAESPATRKHHRMITFLRMRSVCRMFTLAQHALSNIQTIILGLVCRQEGDKKCLPMLWSPHKFISNVDKV